jgi:FkbM family methyltransferase
MPSTLLSPQGRAIARSEASRGSDFGGSAFAPALSRRHRPVGVRAVGWLAHATWRWRGYRLARSAAWHVGEALGPRVLIGRTQKGSPIALLMEDHQHRHLYFLRQYEPDVSALFERVVRPGDTVFDVGANAGYFSLLARDLGARAFAFEPNPVALTLIGCTVALCGRGVTVVPCACSDHDGAATLYPDSLGNTGMASLERPNGRPVQVPALRLDTFAAARNLRPALVKVDAEGHELAVIAGAGRLLAEIRPLAVIETSSVTTLAAMSALDYVPRRIAPDGGLVAHPGVLDATSYENVCFVPVERVGATS